MFQPLFDEDEIPNKFSTVDWPDWVDWKERFRLIVQINNWNHVNARRWILLSITGEARKVSNYIVDFKNVDDTNDYEELLAEFDKIYMSCAQSDLARMQILRDKVKQFADESLSEFKHRCVRIFQRAHPEMQDFITLDKEIRLVDLFVHGIRDCKVKKKVLMQRPTSVHEALDKASWMEHVERVMAKKPREQMIAMDKLPFSKRSVWGQLHHNSFKNQIFIMYHGTNAVNAEGILNNGFRRSPKERNMLGKGIYVAKDIQKTDRYGPITFKLLVYTGSIIKIDYQGHPRQKNWQRNYQSAWVPPNCGMVKSGLQENCIRDPKQIRILGVIRGFESLSYGAKRMTVDLSNQ